MSSNCYQHIPVLLMEAIDALNIKADGCYLDCTFGRGGHSRLILERLNNKGQLIAIDRDAEAILEGKKIEDSKFSIERANFSAMQDILKKKEFKN